MTPAQAAKVRAEKTYPVGTRVEMVHCTDIYAPIEAGDTGTVDFIDDAGTLFVKWDSGRSLGVIIGQDRIRKI